MSDFINLLDNQKTYFYTDDYKVLKRLELLKRLKNILIEEEENIYEALKIDFNKSKVESYMTEFSRILNELNYFIKHIKRLTKKRVLLNDIRTLFSSRNYVQYVPYGSVFIMCQFGLPFYFSFIPLIGAIACGNTVFIKLVDYAPNCNKLIFKIIGSIFKKSQVIVLDETLDEEKMKEIYSLNFDLVFFAGTQKKGKAIIKEFAPRNIETKVFLINKNPLVIDRTSNLESAAKKILWAKTINSGLTFYSPNFILIHESVYNSFIENFKREWEAQYLQKEEYKDNYTKIPTPELFDDLVKIIEQNKNKIIFGGGYDREKQTIDITLIESENLKSSIMLTDILGPILPVIKYNNISDIFGVIEHNKTPNSIYLFTKDKQLIKEVETMIDSKLLVVNDVMIQIFKKVPIGGIGNSGNISCKRFHSFTTFTYPKVFIKSRKNSFKYRYINVHDDFEKLKKKF